MSDKIKLGTKVLNDILSVDPLHEAEKITGKKIGSEGEGFNDVTASLGFLLMQENANKKNKILSSLGDTTFSMGWDEYTGVVEKIGFTLHQEEKYKSRRDKEETLRVYWHEDGILLTCDSYCNVRNSANISYNWKSFPEFWESGRGRVLGSYHCFKSELDIVIGSNDVREGLIHTIEQLRMWGEFITPWVEQPFLHILHSGDYALAEEKFGRYSIESSAFTTELKNKKVSTLGRLVELITPRN